MSHRGDAQRSNLGKRARGRSQTGRHTRSDFCCRHAEPAVNPQYTDADGRYGWDVAEGCYYVVVLADGYAERVSPIVGVPPAVTDLDLELTPQPKRYLPMILR